MGTPGLESCEAFVPDQIHIIPCGPAPGNRKPRLFSGGVLQRTAVAAIGLHVLLAVAAAGGMLEPQGAGPRTFVTSRKDDARISSHVGFRLVVTCGGLWGHKRVLRRPGRHILQPCDSGSRKATIVSITRMRREKLLRRRDVVRESRRLTFAGWRNGWQPAFRTREGVVCRLSGEHGRAYLMARSAGQGQELLVRGRHSSSERLLVRKLFFTSSGPPPRRPWCWMVSIERGGGRTFRLWKPGTYRIPGVPTGRELRLQEVKRCRLAVGGHELRTWVADTPRSRSRGLQGWQRLTEQEGMLFVLDHPRRPEFLMKSVDFPLAMAFFRRSGRLVHLEHREPGNQRPVVPSKPVSYVLEVKRGWFRKRGLKTGSRLEFCGPATERAE